MAESIKVREPKRDCIFCGDGSCRALKRLHCCIEVKECRFYKSKDDYGESGEPLRKGQYGLR